MKQTLFDLFSLSSIIGIWPRFIEPRLITHTAYSITHKNFPHLHIIQLSDLHLSPFTSTSFLDKIISKTQNLKPDLITFTGDFLCYGRTDQMERLQQFLNQFSAPMGCYAILGNHDYENYVGVLPNRNYGIKKASSPLNQVLKKFINKKLIPTGIVEPDTIGIKPQKQLIDVLKNSPFKLLHNETISLEKINIAGVGEYMCSDINTEKTFKNWDTHKPGLVLLHNPDGLNELKKSPGEIVLSGHTHGGQVNLPWVRDHFLMVENPKRRHGHFQLEQKQLIVHRGLGATFPFRFKAMPEIVSLYLSSHSRLNIKSPVLIARLSRG
ncbi:metallophosphoesterase [Chlamydiales bacterium]|nr:metallophosphoesterase [Chlamydiales bacterium]